MKGPGCTTPKTHTTTITTTTSTPTPTPTSTTTTSTPTPTPTTTTTTTTTTPSPSSTPSCTLECSWSDWMDFGPPTTGPNGGEVVPIGKIRQTYSKICSTPQNVECRAKLYPSLPLSQLGQIVTCNAQEGLICLNQNQGLQQQCFDYEIRVSCCEMKGPGCTTPKTHTTTTSTPTPTPTSTTTTSKPTTSTPTPTPTTTTTTTITTPTPSMTPSCTLECSWSDWMDFGPPTAGPNGGEVVPIRQIRQTYPKICSTPQNVECRAKLYPSLPLSQLGQIVTCNAQEGLICLNQNQGLQQQCFDYEIRVSCCEMKGPGCTTPKTHTTTTSTPTPTPTSTTTTSTPTPTPTTTTTTTTTTPTSSSTPPCMLECSWSDWMDFGPPTTGPNGGEVVPIRRISQTYPKLCSSPQQVECRAKLYPALPLSQLGQIVTCNAQEGLICLNQDQGLQQQCFDYEIRVSCCEMKGPGCTTPKTHTTTITTTTSTPTTTPTSTTTTSTPTPTPTTTTTTTTTTPSPFYTTPCLLECSWSDWMDFGPPTTGPNGGEVVPIRRISQTYPKLCSSPQQVECRGKLYPALPLSQLGPGLHNTQNTHHNNQHTDTYTNKHNNNQQTNNQHTNTYTNNNYYDYYNNTYSFHDTFLGPGLHNTQNTHHNNQHTDTYTNKHNNNQQTNNQHTNTYTNNNYYDYYNNTYSFLDTFVHT
ncbi:mucin-5AC [Clarias gariepinus]|uniref:mucin-5AC n=1 Tax=Clarias gariepinus TaxID=13013 RepID=UPI00234CA3ED|nr:mucin-5AC [Clarias gariepinus]